MPCPPATKNLTHFILPGNSVCTIQFDSTTGLIQSQLTVPHCNRLPNLLEFSISPSKISLRRTAPTFNHGHKPHRACLLPHVRAPHPPSTRKLLQLERLSQYNLRSTTSAFKHALGAPQLWRYITLLLLQHALVGTLHSCPRFTPSGAP